MWAAAEVAWVFLFDAAATPALDPDKALVRLRLEDDREADDADEEREEAALPLSVLPREPGRLPGATEDDPTPRAAGSSPELLPDSESSVLRGLAPGRCEPVLAAAAAAPPPPTRRPTEAPGADIRRPPPPPSRRAEEDECFLRPSAFPAEAAEDGRVPSLTWWSALFPRTCPFIPRLPLLPPLPLLAPLPTELGLPWPEAESFRYEG
jgi:hypothetical protein